MSGRTSISSDEGNGDAYQSGEITSRESASALDDQNTNTSGPSTSRAGWRRVSVGSTVPIQKNTKKKTNAAERQAKKQKIEDEKAKKLAEIETNKMYIPKECMKYMNVEMHPALASTWYDITQEVAASGARVVTTTDMYDPGLVLWSRTTSRTLVPDNGQVGLSRASEPCAYAAYVSSAHDLEAHVARRSLAAHIGLLQRVAQRPLTLLLYRGDYFKSSRRKTSNSNRKLMNEIDLEMAITDLLVSENVDTVVVDTPNQLALQVVQFTKAIAHLPYRKAKQQCEEQAQFYMRGDNKKCVPIDACGNGVSRLWQQMVAVLPQSSLETSRAICAKYPTPKTLYQALLRCNSVNELADVGVSRAAAAESRARRVGPEFARKLHTLLTADSGDTLVD